MMGATMRSVGLDPALEAGGGGSHSMLADTAASQAAGLPIEAVLGVDLGQVAALAPLTSGGPEGWQLLVKRLMDVAVALVILLLVLPVLIVASVGVKLSSPGPVLFRQTRVGRGGSTFTMLKFRTFPIDHVDRVVAVSLHDCPLRWGRLLRRTSIDELPQLLNVLRGEMSVVGPRPERPQFAEPLARTIPEYRERHRAPVGLTGHSQIKGLVGTTSIESRVAADNEYIDQWSLGRDVRILARTVPAVIRKTRR